MALKYLVEHDIKPNLLPSSLSPRKSKTQNWKDKPSSWPDIRTNAQDGHIYLLADTRYPLGLTATITGGYYVNIDGALYGSYNSQATFTMADWSSYTDTEGYTIDYPTGATKAHIIDIYPQNSANSITKFTSARVISGTGHEEQGILWAHFNIDTSFDFAMGVRDSACNLLLEAVTAKNNTINIRTTMNDACYYCSALTYTPVFVAPQSGIALSRSFLHCENLQKVKFKNIIKADSFNSTFEGCYSLLEFPKFDFSQTTNSPRFATNTISLKDTILDISAATILQNFSLYGDNSSYFISGFKGLIVSNQAPFSLNTAPQINIKYTGLDRTALVNLFNSLPSVTSGQIINIVGCTGTADLTADDELIATAKGWTITK